MVGELLANTKTAHHPYILSTTKVFIYLFIKFPFIIFQYNSQNILNFYKCYTHPAELVP
jgi:hypothetical protein